MCRIINDEECRVVKGFDRYCVSISGKVYRIKPLHKVDEEMLKKNKGLYVNRVATNYNKKRKSPPHVYVNLTKPNGDRKMYPTKVAKLVAECFGLGDGTFDREQHDVIFIDENKHNLHLSNLKMRDISKGVGKISIKEVKEIKKQIRKGATLKQLAIKYGVSDMQINRIKTGENWGNGKRKIKAPVAPFEIENGKIRRYIATFKAEAAPKGIRKPFAIKRNPDEPTDNTIIGIVKGYKLTLKHKNITRAQANVNKLNGYFFEQPKSEQTTLFPNM